MGCRIESDMFCILEIAVFVENSSPCLPVCTEELSGDTSARNALGNDQYGWPGSANLCGDLLAFCQWLRDAEIDC